MERIGEGLNTSQVEQIAAPHPPPPSLHRRRRWGLLITYNREGAFQGVVTGCHPCFSGKGPHGSANVMGCWQEKTPPLRFSLQAWHLPCLPWVPRVCCLTYPPPSWLAWMAWSIQTSSLVSLTFLVHSLEPTLCLLQTGTGADTRHGEGPMARPALLSTQRSQTFLVNHLSIEVRTSHPWFLRNSFRSFNLFMYFDMDQLPLWLSW